MPLDIWHKCTELLQDELPSQQFNTWVRPLKVMGDDQDLCLLAPNRFVLDWVKEKYLPRIEELLDELSGGEPPALALAVSSRRPKFGRKKTSRSSTTNRRRESRFTKPAADLFGSKPDTGAIADTSEVAAAVKPAATLTNPFNQPKVAEAPREQVVAAHQPAAAAELTAPGTATAARMQSRFEFDDQTEAGGAAESVHGSGMPVMGGPEQAGSSAGGIRLQNPLAQTARQEPKPQTLQQPEVSLAVQGNTASLLSPAETRPAEKQQVSDRLLTDDMLNPAEAQLPALHQPNPKTSAHDLMPEDISAVIQAHTADQGGTTQAKAAPLKNPFKKNTPESSSPIIQPARQIDVEGGIKHNSALNDGFTFESFVEGKSNQLAVAAARQIAENPGAAYNPLFLYGGVGLGKTHLMHAVGNYLVKQNKNARVVYLHSERFVADMVKALQLNAINDFKRYYRSVDALLIDDIQFFAGKERSQEEFFHTFNALLEGGQQMILTCDRYPKEIKGLEERLKSRFGWGLTVAVEPPELETRVAILMKKAEQVKIDLPHDAAFFIAQRIRSNVRELEGALKRVIASARFMGRPIDIGLIRESLKDLLALQDKQVSIDNIQRTVAEYYKIKISDILSKRRSRSVARPRQVAMALSKELTSHSLPEIGDAYGGRDHTTVLHACRKVKELIESDSEIREDYSNLQRLLTS